MIFAPRKSILTPRRKQGGFLLNPHRFGGGGASAWYDEQVFSFNTPDYGWGNYTIRIVLPPLARSGSKLRITFGTYSTITWSVTTVRIGLKAASGDNYDFDSTPGVVTAGGSGSFAVAGDVVSDEINGAFTAGDRYIVALHFPNPTTLAMAGSPLAAGSVFYKSGDDTATVDATGYTATASQAPRCIKRVEIWSP